MQIIKSELLSGVTHGFFTRQGGVSAGIYTSLNCGRGSNDATDAVTTNRARVADAMGVKADALCSVHQIHSAKAVIVTGPISVPPQADAMVTAQPGLALGILTADCQPVLFADARAGVVGAAHAGWKGALYGVLEATVDAMIALGADRTTTKAVIGPCISQAAYEVGPEFLDTCIGHDPDAARFFGNGMGDRYLFNLPGYGLWRLRGAGIQDVEWTGHCTYRDAERFFSYRRATHQNEADYGRLIACIRA